MLFTSMHFPKSFDPDTATWQERERYVVAQVRNLPSDAAALSEALRIAFEGFFQTIMARHPGAAFGLSYSGHGSGLGALFENTVTVADAHLLMQSWVSQYGGTLFY